MSARRIDLVISDVDGTLVGTDKSLSSGTIAAVARLHTRIVGLFSLIAILPTLLL